MKLSEGARYNFQVEKQIDFDGKYFWVLLGPDNKKYLLNSEEYSSYDIKLGEELNCRLDKINCKGEVFLEPLHPYYTEGSEYEFKVIAYETRINKAGSEQGVVILCGSHINEVLVPAEYFDGSIPKLFSMVTLRIGQIIKGVLSVYINDHSLSHEKSEDSKLYTFKITDESKGIDGRIYYVIRDEDGSQHTIPREYYSHYSFNKGDSFKGRFLRYKEGQEVNVEPESPFFKPGEVYTFTVKEFITLSAGLEDIMILEDEYFNSHQVDPVDNARIGQTLKFRVVKMRKGWPLLEKA